MAQSAAAKGKLFTKLAREITVSAKSGSDANSNSRLRLAIDKARENNMPKDNIERAIKKGTGELEGAQLEEIVYEGYGPGGTAFLVEVMTDNRNRTNPEIRRVFQKNGGNMAEMGAVAWMFKKRCLFEFSSATYTEEQVMNVALEAGADDVTAEADLITVIGEVSVFSQLREAFEKAQLKSSRSELTYIPDTFVTLSGDNAKQALELIQKLDEQDDSQNVYHNIHIEESEMNQLLS
jgi:YebC/PmpR family DNA-binding regulatory protein